jgi:hypothetical protein
MLHPMHSSQCLLALSFGNTPHAPSSDEKEVICCYLFAVNKRSSVKFLSVHFCWYHRGNCMQLGLDVFVVVSDV